MVSIIIPNHNGEKVIKECLESVCALKYPDFEIIVVDDSSGDASISIINKFSPRVRLVENLKNRGFPKTVNRGIRESKGEIVVLLNMDTVVKEGWLSGLVDTLLSDKKIAIVGSKVLAPDGKTIQHAGGVVNSNGLTVHIGRGEIERGQYNQQREVNYVCGASMGFRRALLDEIGPLDEGFTPLYYEDVDLALRARRRGYKVCYVPQSTLIHKENYSTQGLTSRFYFHYHKGRIRFVLKNYNLRELFTRFIGAEIEWLKAFSSRGLIAPLLGAYGMNLCVFPGILYSKRRRFNNLKRAE